MLVIDASVALKWFVEEDGSVQAADLLASDDILIAPDLLVAEVCNAGWKSVRNRMMLPEQHDYAAWRLGSIMDELVPLHTLAPAAVALARSLDHPAYDCFYLALSEQRDARLVTADRRLLTRLQATRWKGRAVDLHVL